VSQKRKERIRELRQQVDQLNKKKNELFDEIVRLDLEERKEEYSCLCVRLNRDIDVFDMAEQEHKHRNPLSVGGFVADTLSARKDCTTCQGTGKPKTQPQHNHFGEVFMPDTCPACRLLQRNID